MNFSLDGTRPDIYKTLRGDNSLEVKRRAFRNVIECGVNKLAVISTVAEGVNDSNMREMMEFIHEHKDHVSVWGFVPLTPCWESKHVKLEPTTTECVEKIFEQMIPDIEFVSTGMMKFEVLSKFFGRQTLGGSHPNCESATLMVSDGSHYVPISSYLTIPLSQLLAELREIDAILLSQSPNSRDGWLQKALFDVKTLSKTVAILYKSMRFRKIFGDRYVFNGMMSLLDLVKGRKIDRILAERTCFKRILTMITIPYEDKGGLEDARLKDCPAVFAYEDVVTGRIKTAAFCSWQTIKDDVCRKIQAHYESEPERKSQKALLS